MLESLADKGDVLAEGTPVHDGILDARCAYAPQTTGTATRCVCFRCGVGCIPFMEGQNQITHSSEVLEGVLESDELRGCGQSLHSDHVSRYNFQVLQSIIRPTGTHIRFQMASRGSEGGVHWGAL